MAGVDDGRCAQAEGAARPLTGVVRDALGVFCTLAPCDARQNACTRLWQAFAPRVRIDASKAV